MYAALYAAFQAAFSLANLRCRRPGHVERISDQCQDLRLTSARLENALQSCCEAGVMNRINNA